MDSATIDEAEIARLRHSIVSLHLDVKLLNLFLRLKAGFQQGIPTAGSGPTRVSIRYGFRAYLLISVSDLAGADAPIRGETLGIRATKECVSVPCKYWQDGDTEVVVGPYEEVRKNNKPDFDGLIKTPSLAILISDAELTELLTYPVSSTETRIRIWTNHPMEPDEVIIGLS